MRNKAFIRTDVNQHHANPPTAQNDRPVPNDPSGVGGSSVPAST